MSDQQHSTEDACFYCATDGELARGFSGKERRTIHMNTSEAQCPVWSPRTEPRPDLFADEPAIRHRRLDVPDAGGAA